MKRLRSLQDRAEASICETCYDLVADLWESRHLIWHEAIEAFCTLCSAFVLLLLTVTAPVSLPVIAWFSRRNSQFEAMRFGWKKGAD